MKKILIFLFVIINLKCFSQNGYELKLEAKMDSPSSQYKIDLHKTSNKAVVYIQKHTGDLEKKSTRDSLRFDYLIRKQIRNKYENQEIELIKDKYKIYIKDSVEIALDNPVISLSDLITNSEKVIREEKLRNKNRIVIDGALVYLSVLCDNGYNYSYFFSSPDNEVYSLVYNYWMEILKFYRNSCENPIL